MGVVNMGARVNGQLKALARAEGHDMASLQVRYAMERFLWRLTQTRFGDRIALKGALLFVTYFGDTHRPTSDIDIEGGGEHTVDDLLVMVREAIEVECADGVTFMPDTIEVRQDRDWNTVASAKVALDARIDTSQVRIRVDAGFGHVMTPDAVEAEYPALLGDMAGMQDVAPIRVKVSPFETMVAEKVYAMALHGAETTRLRDYYDLWTLSQHRNFDGQVLCRAFERTFTQRVHGVPISLDALSDDFVEIGAAGWNRFRRGRGLRFAAPDLEEVVDHLRGFINPVLEASNPQGMDPGSWNPGAGWVSVSRDSIPF